MKKAWIIAQKDILLRFYDRGSLAFLIITPLVITLIMGGVFGGGEDDLNFTISVAVINHDQGYDLQELGNNLMTEDGPITFEMPEGIEIPEDGINLGDSLTELLRSEDVGEILAVTVVNDETVARDRVKSGNSYCCLIILPANLSQSFVEGFPAEIVVYSDPAKGFHRQITESIIQNMLDQFKAIGVMFDVSITQLYLDGALSDEDSTDISEQLSRQIEIDTDNDNENPLASLITLETMDAGGNVVAFDPLAFLAPSMAIMFLAFGASQAGRTILEEERRGTLARLNVGPISPGSILLGKLLGIFFNSALQFGILLLLSVILFQLNWGDPAAVILLAIAVTLAFTSLGLLLSVMARDEAQAGTIGNTILLIFAVMGGNLVSTDNFPAWLQSVAKITPNYWGMQGFIKLGLGQGLNTLGPELLALSTMALLFFGAGMVLYRRRTMI